MEVVIDPRLQYNYASWYLYGINFLRKRATIRFDVAPFRKLLYEKIQDYNSGFAFIVRDGIEEKKFFY